MPNRQWLDEFQRELSRHKLPQREVARLVAELSDHLADLMESLPSSRRTPEAAIVSCLPSAPLQENHMSMEANVAECLGSPAEIAESAIREYYRRQSLLSRSRLAAFCTFVLLPLPALILTWVAAIAALAAFGYLLNWFIPDSSSDWKVTPNWAAGALCFTIAYIVLPAAAIAALFGRIAHRTPHPWRWGLSACLLVALGTMAVRINLTFSETPGKNANARGKNQVMFGAGFAKRLPEVGQYAQFLLPLATGVFVLRRSARSTKLPEGDPTSPARETPDEYGMARAA